MRSAPASIRCVRSEVLTRTSASSRRRLPDGRCSSFRNRRRSPALRQRIVSRGARTMPQLPRLGGMRWLRSSAPAVGTHRLQRICSVGRVSARGGRPISPDGNSILRTAPQGKLRTRPDGCDLEIYSGQPVHIRGLLTYICANCDPRGFVRLRRLILAGGRTHMGSQIRYNEHAPYTPAPAISATS